MRHDPTVFTFFYIFERTFAMTLVTVAQLKYYIQGKNLEC